MPLFAPGSLPYRARSGHGRTSVGRFTGEVLSAIALPTDTR
jgi:hypothetical protein